MVPHRPRAFGDDAETNRVGSSMRKALSFMGATVGSYAGWYVGAPVGFMTAFMLSMVGSGLGIYVGLRVARNYE
jgi:hypothetical protein